MDPCAINGLRKRRVTRFSPAGVSPRAATVSDSASALPSQASNPAGSGRSSPPAQRVTRVSVASARSAARSLGEATPRNAPSVPHEHGVRVRCPESSLVERDKRCAGAGRPQNAAVQHVGQADVMDEGPRAEGTPRQVGSQHIGGGPASDRPGDAVSGAVERHAVRQLAIAEPRVARPLQHPVLDRDGFGGAIEPPRSLGHEQRPCLGRSLPDGHAAMAHRERAGCHALVGTEARGGRPEADGRRWQAELGRRDAGERREQALPQLDLAGMERHAAVGREGNPAREARLGRETAGEPGAGQDFSQARPLPS